MKPRSSKYSRNRMPIACCNLKAAWLVVVWVRVVGFTAISRVRQTYSQVNHAIVKSGVQEYPFELCLFCRIILGVRTRRILYAERQYGLKARLKVDLDRCSSAFASFLNTARQTWVMWISTS